MENIHSSLFAWKKASGKHIGKSSLSQIGGTNFPKSFMMQSQWTGRVMEFTIDQHTMIENEFFDGEAVAYRAGNVEVTIWNSDIELARS